MVLALVTLGAVIGLTRYAEPQHHHTTAGRRTGPRLRTTADLPRTAAR